MDCLTPPMTEHCYNACWCCHSTAHGFTDPRNPYLHFQWGCLHPPWRDLASNTKVEFRQRSGDVPWHNRLWSMVATSWTPSQRPPGSNLDILKLRANSAHSGRSCISLIGGKHWCYIDQPASPKECWTTSGKSTLTNTTRPARGIASSSASKGFGHQVKQGLRPCLAQGQDRWLMSIVFFSKDIPHMRRWPGKSVQIYSSAHVVVWGKQHMQKL